MKKSVRIGVSRFLVNIYHWENKPEGLIEYNELRESVVPKIMSKAAFYRYWKQAREEKLIKAKLVCFDMFLYLTKKGIKLLEKHTDAMKYKR